VQAFAGGGARATLPLNFRVRFALHQQSQLRRHIHSHYWPALRLWRAHPLVCARVKAHNEVQRGNLGNVHT